MSVHYGLIQLVDEDTPPEIVAGFVIGDVSLDFLIRHIHSPHEVDVQGTGDWLLPFNHLETKAFAALPVGENGRSNVNSLVLIINV